VKRFILIHLLKRGSYGLETHPNMFAPIPLLTLMMLSLRILRLMHKSHSLEKEDSKNIDNNIARGKAPLKHYSTEEDVTSLGVGDNVNKDNGFLGDIIKESTSFKHTIPENA
jgi:hypothetical protein